MHIFSPAQRLVQADGGGIAGVCLNKDHVDAAR